MRDSRPKRGSKEPGAHWYYNNWDFNVLGTIFREQTGEDIYEAFKKRIGDAVGMQDYFVEKQRYGYEQLRGTKAFRNLPYKHGDSPAGKHLPARDRGWYVGHLPIRSCGIFQPEAVALLTGRALAALLLSFLILAGSLAVVISNLPQ